MVRSERLAAAAAILRMSGLLLDFMISRRENMSVYMKGNNRSVPTDRVEQEFQLMHTFLEVEKQFTTTEDKTVLA